jgi:hypothetical protein
MKTTLLLKLSAMAVFVLFINPIFAQEKLTEEKKYHLTFTESKDLDDQYQVVYFCFSEIKNEEHKQKLISALESKDFIKSARIYKDLYGYDRCQMTLLQTTTPEKVRDVLTQNNTDFKFVSVSQSITTTTTTTTTK